MKKTISLLLALCCLFAVLIWIIIQHQWNNENRFLFPKNNKKPF